MNKTMRTLIAITFTFFLCANAIAMTDVFSFAETNIEFEFDFETEEELKEDFINERVISHSKIATSNIFLTNKTDYLEVHKDYYPPNLSIDIQPPIA